MLAPVWKVVIVFSCESTQLSRDRIAKETVGFTQGYNLSDRGGEKYKHVLIAEMHAEILMANQFSFWQNMDGLRLWCVSCRKISLHKI